MKKIIIFNTLLVLAMVITGIYYISLYDDISKNIVRLHVISNSNSEEDTEIKLLVRDKILDEVRDRIDKKSTRQEVLNSLEDMEKSANEYLKSQNIGYGAEISLGNTDIVRKEYNGIILPEGEYLAIRVVLGEGKGENWWCVAYPPLCFTENTTGEISSEGEKLLRGTMSDESYRLITSDIKYEFKILELAKKIVKALQK